MSEKNKKIKLNKEKQKRKENRLHDDSDDERMYVPVFMDALKAEAALEGRICVQGL